MQVRDRVFDVIVLVLAGAVFCREHATAMDLAEIPIGKFVVSLGLLGFFVIDSQIPPAVFGKAVEANEFIFLLGSRPVLAPCISLVQYNPSFVDKLPGMIKMPGGLTSRSWICPLEVATIGIDGRSSPVTDKTRRRWP